LNGWIVKKLNQFLVQPFNNPTIQRYTCLRNIPPGLVHQQFIFQELRHFNNGVVVFAGRIAKLVRINADAGVDVVVKR